MIEYVGLDLFCGGGGATAGYQRGFESAGVRVRMVGIDHRPMPRYCGNQFIQADVMDVLQDRDFIKSFDFVHMSPPCQKFSPTRTLGNKGGREHDDLLTPALALVKAEYSDMLWITENVPQAPMFSRVHQILRLCGSSFPGHSGFDERRLLHRHRSFRLHNFVVPKMLCRHNGYKPKGVYGSLNSDTLGGGEMADNFAEACKLMGIDWMLWGELKEAIPPAYTQYITEAPGGLVERVTALVA